LIPDPTVAYTSANSTGSIAFTPLSDQSGTATITVTVEDGGLDGDLNTVGDNATFSRTFDVTVNPINFYEDEADLHLEFDDDDQNVSVVATATGHEFTLTNGLWSGTDSANVSGNGGSVLTVSAAGVAQFDTVHIDDMASNGSVTFNDSGLSFYGDSFEINLDDATAGTISFSGTTAFTGSASLSALTTRNIVASANSVVRTVDGDITLSANMQATTTAGSFAGITVSDGVVEATGSGHLALLGTGGADNDTVGVHLNFGSQIIGGDSADSSLTIQGAGGTGNGNLNRGVYLAGDGTTVSSIGGNVTITGTGGGSGSGEFNAGVVVASNSTITAGGNGVVSVHGTGKPNRQ
jgi:hypothetical protein